MRARGAFGCGLFASVALCGAALIVYFVWFAPAASKTRLVVYGNVDVREADLSFRVPGRIDKMAVDEGDAVAAGTLLAALDDAPYRDRLRQAEAEADRQRSQLHELLAGSRPQEIARAAADVEAAKAKLSLAQATLARQEKLAASGAGTKQALDDARTARDRASAELAAGRQTLALLRAGPRKERIEAARAGLKALLAARDSAQVALSDTVLRAPEAGTIRVRVQEPGSVVGAGQPVYTLALKHPVFVRAYVPEPDLGKVRPGAAVDVYTDTRPDRPYRGTVGFVSPAAEFTPKNVETPELRTNLVFRFRVIVSNPDSLLRQGMPVTVIVPLEGKGPAETPRGG